MKKMGWSLALCAFLCCCSGMCDDVMPKHQWTFTFKQPKHAFATGLKKSPKRESGQIERKFLLADDKLPAKFSVSQVVPFIDPYDQGQCGSCVTNAAAMAIMYDYKLHQVALPYLSRQFIMDCGGGGGCNGSYADRVLGDVMRLGGAPDEAAYPYQARNMRCQNTSSPLLGNIKTKTQIDSSAKSLASAIWNSGKGRAVMTTIGANNTFSGYDSGVFNACSPTSTNHEVIVVGFDFSDSVDANGVVQFDANGNLPAGKGIIDIQNSWGKVFGAHAPSAPGHITMALTDSRGRRCQNVTEELYVVDSGLPDPKPPEPPAPVPSKFTIDWSMLFHVFLGLGAASGIAALVVVLVSRKKQVA